MKVGKTARGFARIDFTDEYGNKCSLQESSWAEKDAIWLGVDETRMHLARAQAKKLLPHLQAFVETGSIRLPKKKA